MRLALVLPSLAALILAGCNQGGSVTATNESGESIAKKVAAANIKPQPGRWEAKMKVEKFDIAGVPEQAKAAMSKQMSAEQTVVSCLTPEQVNQPNGAFFAGGTEDCTYKHFTMAGGKVDAEMTCGKEMFHQDMTMKGTYDEANYAIQATAKSEVQAGKPMSITMMIVAKRVGECKGDEAGAARSQTAKVPQ